jgi:hypothetical protein
VAHESMVSRLPRISVLSPPGMTVRRSRSAGCVMMFDDRGSVAGSPPRGGAWQRRSKIPIGADKIENWRDFLPVLWIRQC